MLSVEAAFTVGWIGEALTASFAAGLSPEALTTVAPHPWAEIARVARLHRCESLLLGLSNLTDRVMETHIERLISRVDCDVVVLRAPPGWQLAETRRVLVPVGGRGDHDVLRARLLGSLCRTGMREVTFLRVLPPHVTDAALDDAGRVLSRLAEEEGPSGSQVRVLRGDSIAAEVTRRAADHGLVILGLQRLARRQKVFGTVALQVARAARCPVILISRRG